MMQPTGFEFQMPKVEGSYNDNQYNFTAEDIRFTRSKGKKALYAILLKWPDAGAVTIYHEGWTDFNKDATQPYSLNSSKGAEFAGSRGR